MSVQIAEYAACKQLCYAGSQ